MKIRLGNTGACIHVGVLPFLFWCVIAGETRTLLFSAFSLAVHEAAHWIAAKNLGCTAAGLTVYPFGAVMRLDRLTHFEGAEAVVAAAGPVASLSAAGTMQLSESLFGAQPWTETLIHVNLAIGLLNLLPAYPLDGGRIFRSLLSRCLSERASKRLLLTFTAVIAAALFGVGVWLILRGIPYWTLLLLPPFLVVSAVSEWRTPDAGIVSRVLERKERMLRGEPQTAKIVVVPADCTLGEALACLSPSRFTILRIRTGSRYAELDEGALLETAAKRGVRTPLKNVISQLTLR